jgi:hypothetical protein
MIYDKAYMVEGVRATLDENEAEEERIFNDESRSTAGRNMALSRISRERDILVLVSELLPRVPDTVQLSVQAVRGYQKLCERTKRRLPDGTL